MLFIFTVLVVVATVHGSSIACEETEDGCKFSKFILLNISFTCTRSLSWKRRRNKVIKKRERKRGKSNKTEKIRMEKKERNIFLGNENHEWKAVVKVTFDTWYFWIWTLSSRVAYHRTLDFPSFVIVSVWCAVLSLGVRVFSQGSLVFHPFLSWHD